MSGLSDPVLSSLPNATSHTSCANWDKGALVRRTDRSHFFLLCLQDPPFGTRVLAVIQRNLLPRHRFAPTSEVIRPIEVEHQKSILEEPTITGGC